MSINNVYSGLARAVNHINNPNLPTGVLIEEIPADVGRSYEGYKRGGILEGAEKLRKELMSAAVWIAGIPVFQKANELDFPLKYQEYIVPDVYYLEKYNRIMGIGHPILALFRRFGYIFRCIRYGHISNIISGIKKRIQ